MSTQLIPYSLRRNESVRTGVIRILNAMGESARALSEKPESDLEESIHGIRTLIKRLRAYLWFLRPTIGKAHYAQSNAILRKAAQRLSKTRDLHAVASALTRAAIPETGEKHLQALVQVSQAFAQQTAATQKADKGIRTLEKVADKVIQTISTAVTSVERNVREIHSPGHRLKKAFTLTRRAMKATTRKKDPRLVHEWRKKTKRLFYMLQLTAHLPDAGMVEYLQKVDNLQENLGDFQDNIVAENHLRRRSPDIDTGHLKRTIRLLHQHRKVLLKEAHHHWNAILAEI